MQINNRKRNNTGQAVIDTTLVVMALSIILFASLKMFIWFNQCLVERQEAYNSGGLTSYTYTPARLYLIKGEEPNSGKGEEE